MVVMAVMVKQTALWQHGENIGEDRG